MKVIWEVLHSPQIQTLRQRVHGVQFVEGGIIETASLPGIIVIIILTIIITIIVITWGPAQTRGGRARIWTRSRDNQPQKGPRQTGSQSVILNSQKAFLNQHYNLSEVKEKLSADVVFSRGVFWVLPGLQRVGVLQQHIQREVGVAVVIRVHPNLN